MNFLVQTQNTDLLVETIKAFFIIIYTYKIMFKLLNYSAKNKGLYVRIAIGAIFITLIYTFAKLKSNFLYSTVLLILLLIISTNKILKYSLGYLIFTSIASLGINYVILLISVIISFIPNAIFNIENRFIGLAIIILVYSTFICFFTKLKRIKNGIPFLNSKMNNDYFDMVILDISVIVLFSVIILSEFNKKITYNINQ